MSKLRDFLYIKSLRKEMSGDNVTEIFTSLSDALDKFWQKSFKLNLITPFWILKLF